MGRINFQKKSTMFSAQKRKGFMLVEMLVYLAILLVVVGIIIVSLLTLQTVFSQARANHTLTQSAGASLERMLFELQQGDSVVLGESTFATSSGALTISRGARTTRFYLADEQLFVSSDGSAGEPLTPESVRVQELLFTHYENDHTEAVRIELIAQYTNRFTATTKIYNAMSVLRNSYE